MPAGIFVILMNMCEVVKVWSLVAWLEAASQKVELPRAVFPSLLGYMVCPFGCARLGAPPRLAVRGSPLLGSLTLFPSHPGYHKYEFNTGHPN